MDPKNLQKKMKICKKKRHFFENLAKNRKFLKIDCKNLYKIPEILNFGCGNDYSIIKKKYIFYGFVYSNNWFVVKNGQKW